MKFSDGRTILMAVLHWCISSRVYGAAIPLSMDFDLTLITQNASTDHGTILYISIWQEAAFFAGPEERAGQVGAVC